MTEKYINIDLSDPRSEAIAEVISNKTCKKILNIIAEKEMSEGDITKALGTPANTINYNVKKLIDSGLIEKTPTYFWSVKGKRISTYRVSNKRIVITPRTSTKGVIPAVLLSGIAAVIIKKLAAPVYSGLQTAKQTANSAAAPSTEILADAARAAKEQAAQTVSIFSQSWIWFFIGALSSLIIFFTWNWLINRRSFK